MTTNALATFGGRDDIKELGYRLQKMMPSAQSFSGEEALAVAQIAVAHRLDPFNGEVWGLKSYNGQWYGVMVGIKGLRKCARRAAAEENGSYWIDNVLTDPKKYNVTQKDAVVYECILRDSVNTQAYGQAIHALTDSGIPYKEAVEMVGPSPKVVGVGIADPSEKSKMGLHARAKKRAEADAIKQRYDVDFGEAAQFTPEEPGDFVEVEAENLPDDFDNGVEEDFPKKSAEDAVSELMGESKAMPHPDTANRPYTPEQLKIKIDERVKHHLEKKTLASQQDRNVLASILDGVLIEVTKRYELCKWLVGQSSTKKMKQADVNAIFDWLGTDRVFNATPSDEVVKEIHSAHTATLKASGQQELI